MKTPLIYVTILLIIQAVVFLLLQVVVFKLAAEVVFAGNRLFDQGVKTIINIIIGCVWLSSWKKLGEKIYQKYKN